ncbi:hypothetical protein EWI31_13085 [Streptomyces tsukubensis]|uniref:Uncharacterized protein n=1 Tax=Streptomyces tsukubensis (strain DSM 42081 / NBRC 108919 / NRRL 18488 / 9993) TaxID=1114943 RepID=A0A7G3UFY7_STRT9|nr:hypothetical protein STSU_013290 [Streptomyces tsukubensis NRRL18488]TAI44400.1 hypothetical protein EWI31_13085 [Streptomyces tsukubensis]
MDITIPVATTPAITTVASAPPPIISSRRRRARAAEASARAAQSGVAPDGAVPSPKPARPPYGSWPKGGCPCGSPPCQGCWFRPSPAPHGGPPCPKLMPRILGPLIWTLLGSRASPSYRWGAPSHARSLRCRQSPTAPWAWRPGWYPHRVDSILRLAIHGTRPSPYAWRRGWCPHSLIQPGPKERT